MIKSNKRYKTLKQTPGENFQKNMTLDRWTEHLCKDHPVVEDCDPWDEQSQGEKHCDLPWSLLPRGCSQPRSRAMEPGTRIFQQRFKLRDHKASRKRKLSRIGRKKEEGRWGDRDRQREAEVLTAEDLQLCAGFGPRRGWAKKQSSCGDHSQDWQGSENSGFLIRQKAKISSHKSAWQRRRLWGREVAKS